MPMGCVTGRRRIRAAWRKDGRDLRVGPFRGEEGGPALENREVK